MSDLRGVATNRTAPELMMGLLVLLLAAASPRPTQAAFEASEYFPLNPGSQWVFRDPAFSGFLRQGISFGPVLNGVQTTNVVGSGSGPLASALVGAESYSNDQNGVRLHQVVLGTDAVTLSPPITILRPQFDPGDSVSSAGTAVFHLNQGVISVTLDYSATSQVEAVEQVTAPLGVFDSVRVRIELNVSGMVEGMRISVSDSSAISLARFIGPVRLFGVDEFIGSYDARLASVFVDMDGDGVNVTNDNCRGLSNPAQTDTDADDLGNACDDDDDNDGVGDDGDAFALDPAASRDTDGDGKPDQYNANATAQQISASPLAEDLDDDGDGVNDDVDAFPLNGKETADSDNDGMGDNFEHRFGLNANHAEDAGNDDDADGSTNLAEFQAGRDPLLNEPAVLGVINAFVLGSR